MNTEQLTEQEALVFGQRLDAFAAGLSPRERTFLNAILHDAESAQHDGVDHRTPGELAVAIQRTYGTPPISLNPLPIPQRPPPSLATQRNIEDPDDTHHVNKG